MKSRIALLIALLVLALTFSAVVAQEQTLLELAAANPDLSTFTAIVAASGMTAGDAPMTVFAPNNAAFEKVPAVVVEYLTAHPEELLRVLSYHVVPGAAWLTADAVAGDVASAEGGALTIAVGDMGVTVQGAHIVAADAVASDGVLQVIDTVLLPEVTLPEVSALELEGAIVADGSSTVEPLALAIANQFTEEGFTGDLSIGESGTGGGFKAFCEEGVTDISNASRPIKHSKEAGKDEEFEKCQKIGRDPIGFRIGTDGLTIVTNPENDFATDLTLEEIAVLFSTAVKWSDVRADFPAEDIVRYIPGTDSGTFDYFVEVTFAKDSAPILAASNLNASENDNVLVQGVESNKYAVGFFGYAYYAANSASLKAVAVNGVVPSFETVEAGSYKYARPLFVYSTAAIMQEKPQVAGFINFFLTNVNDTIGDVGYFPASEQALNASKWLWLAAVG